MNSQSDLFIGIDGGTSVIKSVLFDLAGTEMDTAQATVPIASPRPGYQEQDMMLVWEATLKTLSDLIGRHPNIKQHLRAIGITAQGAGCWLIDDHGQPVGNAILWSDARAADIISDWEQRKVADTVYDICGSIQYSGCQSAIVSWLAAHDTQKLKAARHLLWCKDWIKFKLSGIVSTDPSDASISFMDTANWSYRSELLTLMGINAYAHLLPEIEPPGQSSGTLLPAIADALGLSRDIAVVGAPFDMIASAMGVGAVSEGQACSILGTALISEVVLDHFASAPHNIGFTICHGVPNRWVRAMAAMMGTPNLDWFLAQFGHADQCAAEEAGLSIYTHLEERLAHIPIGSDGIIYHPYLSPAGERSPFVNENVKAQFVGLSQAHSRHHVLRAVYEGMVLAMMHCYDSIPVDIQRVSLSGGGAKSELWCQMIADALGVEVQVPSGTEFGAKGAVINAMVARGYFRDHAAAVDNLVQVDRQYTPTVGATKQYQALYQIYLGVVHCMRATWDALAAYRQQAGTEANA